jgi:hypothetical protein
MLKRIPVSAVLAGLALTGALSACASSAQPTAAQHSASAGASTSTTSSPTSPASTSSARPSTGTNSASPPVDVAPIIFAVRLGRAFAPTTLRLSPGQHFEVIVESSVKASVLGMSGSCSGTTAGINGGMLTVHCTSGNYYYTAERAGTTELMATVRPNCPKGHLCPEWVAVATLKITIV